MAQDLETILRSVPPGTRVGALLRRLDEEKRRREIRDQLIIASVAFEVTRAMEKDLRA